MKLKRRAFLGAVGTGITTVGTIQATTTTRPSKKTREIGETGGSKDVTIGDGTLSEDGRRRPHEVMLTNPTQDSWTTHLSICRPDGSVALDETYTLEPEETVAVSLTTPLRYSATTRIPETDASKTVDIALEWFDCNFSSTSFGIRSNGQLTAATQSTLMACPSLETARVAATEQRSLSLGDGSLTDKSDRKPHGVTLHNPTDQTWTARLEIANENDVLLDGLYTLEPSSTVAVTLTDSGHYHGTASIPTTGTSETFTIEPSRFDCNPSSTSITIQPDSDLKTTLISTKMACHIE